MFTISAGERRIGPGEPCFVAAEVGINHNGDIELAHALVDAAADAGADGVKFQNYRTEDFILDRTLTYEYVSQGSKIKETQYDMFKRYELPPAAFKELKSHCDERRIIFFSTPTSEDGVNDLKAINVPLMKNGSDYLPHLTLIEAMARSGIPTILSTGMATLAEIDDAVRAFREVGGTHLVLLQCTSAYPTPPEDVHLRKIPTLAAAFGCLVGFSDHTEGVTAAIGAVTLGACFVEKHFTLNKELPGPDHRFSADPAEMAALVSSVRNIQVALGNPVIGPAATESAGREEYRISCVAARPLEPRQILLESDISYCRPSSGFPPKMHTWLIGRELIRSVPVGQPFTPQDFR